MKSQSIEEWRKYFEGGDCSIYQIINNAIRVAALDQPEEFKLRRNKVLESLYSCQFTGNCCCVDQTTEQDIHTTISQVFRDCKKACPQNETTKKVDDSAVAGGGGATGQQANEPGNSIIEDDLDQNIRFVLQIKDQLESNKLMESEIYESLRKLRSLVRSVSVIEATKIGSTISNFRQHRSKEISLLATIMTDQWKSMIAGLVDNKTAETTTEKSKNPAPNFVLEEWREFPSIEFVPQLPVELSENFLDDDMDDYENAAGNKDDNETKLKTKRESAEKFKSCRFNETSKKSTAEVENSSGATTEKNPSMGNKRKMEYAELDTPTIKRQKSAKSAPNPNLPKTEQKPRVKKEVQNHNSEPRTRYRALRMSADPTHAITPRARESRRSSGNTAMQERLETSKNKLQAGYQAHDVGRFAAKRNIQLIPEGDVHKKASTSLSKNQTRK